MFCSPLSLCSWPFTSSTLLHYLRTTHSRSSTEQKSKNLSLNDDDNNATDSVYHKNGRTSKYMVSTITSRLSAPRLGMYFCDICNNIFIYIYKYNIFYSCRMRNPRVFRLHYICRYFSFGNTKSIKANIVYNTIIYSFYAYTFEVRLNVIQSDSPSTLTFIFFLKW